MNLKVKTINSYQMFRLLQEPGFESLSHKSATSTRIMARKGTFGEIEVVTYRGRDSIMIDLRNAYGHYFSKVISWDDFVKKVNKWAEGENE